MNSNSYETTALGATSESLVQLFLTERGWLVENLSQDKQYQQKDIDFLATKDGETRTVEVKQDNRCGQTGNFLLETITNCRTGGKGWFAKTQADYIIFHNTIGGELLTTATNYLRAYLAMPGNQSRLACICNN